MSKNEGRILGLEAEEEGLVERLKGKSRLEGWRTRARLWKIRRELSWRRRAMGPGTGYWSKVHAYRGFR